MPGQRSKPENPADLGLSETLSKMSKVVDQDKVSEMMEIQTKALSRLEETNKNLVACNSLAQEKFATISKLFKKSSKQLAEAKKDLDYVHKKLAILKRDIIKTMPEHERSQYRGPEDEN